MSLKKYGCYNDRLIEGLKDLDQRACNTKGKEWDGITHIVWEWTNHSIFKSKGTSWFINDGLNRTVSYACYWMDKYMRDEKGSKLGRNWEQVASKWKDQQITSLARVLNIAA